MTTKPDNKRIRAWRDLQAQYTRYQTQAPNPSWLPKPKWNKHFTEQDYIAQLINVQILAEKDDVKTPEENESKLDASDQAIDYQIDSPHEQVLELQEQALKASYLEHGQQADRKVNVDWGSAAQIPAPLEFVDTDNLNPNQTYAVNIEIDFVFDYEDTKKTWVSDTLRYTPDNINQALFELRVRWLRPLVTVMGLPIFESVPRVYINKTQEDSRPLSTMPLFTKRPPALDILKHVKLTALDPDHKTLNCVQQGLLERLHNAPTEMRYDILTMGSPSIGTTPKQVREFCQKWEIRCEIRSQRLNEIIEEYNPPVPQHQFKPIVAVAGYSHLYVLKSGVLKLHNKAPPPITKVVKCLNDIIDLDTTIPQDVDIQVRDGEVYIRSCILNNIRYVDNPHYKWCYKILECFNAHTMLTPQIQITDVLPLIERAYGGSAVSIWAQSEKYIQYADVYKNPNVPPKHKPFISAQVTTHHKTVYTIQQLRSMKSPQFNFTEFYDEDYQDIKEPIITIDINLCYFNQCIDLEYMIEIRDTEQSNTPVLFECRPLGPPNRLMRDVNYYTQETLNVADHFNIKYEILSTINGTKKPNYATSLYPKVFKHALRILKNAPRELLLNGSERDTTKLIFNKRIGCMERDARSNSHIVNPIIVSKDECDKLRHSKSWDLPNDRVAIADIEDRFNPYTMKPVNIQIKNACDRAIFLKIHELGLTNDQIVQVKTDSLSYIAKTPEQKNPILFPVWKIEEYKPIEKSAELNQDKFDTKIDERINPKNSRTIAPAGFGKSHIMCDSLENLTEKTLILSPTTACLDNVKNGLEARNFKYGEFEDDELLTVACIQKYTVNNILPQGYTHVIADEIGMFDATSVKALIQIAYTGVRLSIYGDYDQVKPYGHTRAMNGQNYLNDIFPNVIKLEKNMRNNFTKSYYDSLIHSDDHEYLVQELDKWSDPNSENIICYRHKTVKAENIAYLEKHNLKPHSINVKLRNKKGRIATIIHSAENGILLSNGEIINQSQIGLSTSDNKSYTVAFARTIYSWQCFTVPDFRWSALDNKFATPDVAYTAISRLRQH